jgi:hypothetical protein
MSNKADYLISKNHSSCCVSLNHCVSEGEESSITYLPQTRSFLLSSAPGSYLEMQYCPFCGKKLPIDLTDMLTLIIYEELKLRDFDDPDLPHEFRSDIWWKSRGL